MLERTIENYLVDAAKAAGGWAIKIPAVFVRGIPDRLCLFPGGRVAFVEVKAPGEKPRPTQIVIHKKLEKIGFPVSVIDSREGVNALIKKYA